MRDDWVLYELPAFLLSPWLLSGLFRCQVSAWLVWLIVGSVYLNFRKRPLLGGISLACAALMKVFPAAFLVWFVWRRQWRLVGGFLLAIGIGGFVLPSAVFGWQQNIDYWQQWVNRMAKPALASNDQRQDNPLYGQVLDGKRQRNQSIESALLSFDIPSTETKPLLVGIALIMTGLMLWASRGLENAEALVIAAAFMTWNVLIPPISHSHYFALLLFPFDMLSAAAFKESDPFIRRMSQGMLALFFVVGLASTLHESLMLYRPLCWLALGVWITLLIVASRLKQRTPRLA